VQWGGVKYCKCYWF